MSDRPHIQTITLLVALMVFIFLGGFLAWAFLAPLESAAIAPGKVVVAGNRRVIQHLEGGIVKQMFVKDGSFVKKGEIVVKLDKVQAEAANLINLHDYWTLLGRRARIEAEMQEKSRIAFPKVLTDNKAPKTQDVIRLQKAVFQSHKTSFESTVEIYNQRIEQLQAQIQGQQAQLTANERQLELINHELKDVKVLAEKRLIKQGRLHAVERESAKLEGMDGEIKAGIARLEQKIGETKLEIIAVANEKRKELLAELRETLAELSKSRERAKASEDTLKRIAIRSPIAGTVVNMKVHTIGGVVKPGEALMEIVPKNEALVIDAKLSPLDIDVVHPGLKAKVSLSGLSKRNTPVLLGKVVHVSADVLTGQPPNNQPYYSVEVEIPGEELQKLNGQELYPGMPAEVMIIVKKATPWEYFTDPIRVFPEFCVSSPH